MKSGAEYAGDKIDRKVEEKSGDLIMRRLRGVKNKNTPTTIPTRKEEENTDMMLNRLISGEGLLLEKKKKKQRVQISSNTWTNILNFYLHHYYNHDIMAFISSECYNEMNW